ncbi:hypothetical protein Dsin_021874 [Dipteronia sinensis]|uniref:RNase H type-1 domain-containing protein n=1 Tax=Dipteronia sinensis TaxID=43782 RepID=A0AAE0DZI9_9ROSI|nr:hypothetical protein Dsin_021874 [Dipteronia sinensis]
MPANSIVVLIESSRGGTIMVIFLSSRRIWVALRWLGLLYVLGGLYGVLKSLIEFFTSFRAYYMARFSPIIKGLFVVFLLMLLTLDVTLVSKTLTTFCMSVDTPLLSGKKYPKASLPLSHLEGIGSVLEAELCGMFESLLMSWNSGFRRVIIEYDSLSAVQLHYNEISSNHPLFSLIVSCKSRVATDWNCVVKHVYREGNLLADGVARIGHSMDIGLVYFEAPPPHISSYFDADFIGLACFRQSSVLSSFVA